MTDPRPSLGTALPWPPQWAKPQPIKYAFAAAFFAFFGCMGIAAGVSIFLPGFTDDRAYLLVLAAPLLLGIAAIVVLTRVRVRGRSVSPVHSAPLGTTGEPGLVIPYLRALGIVYLTIVAAMLVFFTVIAVVTLVALTNADAGNPALDIQAVVCLGFVGYLSWLFIEVGRKRLTTGAVVLTPQGVYHRSWAFDSFLPWDQTVSVSAHDLDGQVICVVAYDNSRPQFNRRSKMWKQSEYKRAPNTVIRGMYLSIDPAMALHVIRYYHASPGARAELGSESALRRVQSGDM